MFKYIHKYIKLIVITHIMNQPKRLLDKVGTLSLEQAYVIFAVIYMPFTVLLSHRGFIAESLLNIYTLALMIVGVILVGKFMVYLGKLANEHNSQYGSLWVMYVLDVLIPLVTFKVYGLVITNMLPERHVGILCEIVNFVRSLMWVFQYQRTLNILILATLVVFGGFAVWSVGRNK